MTSAAQGLHLTFSNWLNALISDPYAGSATDELLSLQSVQAMSFILEGFVDDSRLVWLTISVAFGNYAITNVIY